MGIRHAKAYTLRGRPSTKLEQRLFKAWQLSNHLKNPSISSKPDRAHICTINGAIRGTATISPIPNITTNERPLVTTTVFATTTENTQFAYQASTLTNPNPTISPTFMEKNYNILESLLRERRRHLRNKDLRTELEYFGEDYDEDRDMEPRPERRREATPTLWLRSPGVRRQRERVMGFEDAPNKEGNMREGMPKVLGLQRLKQGKVKIQGRIFPHF
nr:hypothetical protein [Tanacetum cinerariifolium]